MNQKTIIAILGVTVFILLGTTVYFATISKSNQQSATTQKTTQELVPTPTSEAQITPTTQTNEVALVDWKIYHNDKFGFEMKYPKEWSYSEVDNLKDHSTYTVYFGVPIVSDGPPADQWGVYIYNKEVANNPYQINDLIARIGSQFEDRHESRRDIKIDSEEAMLVTVTTNHIEDWISEHVIFEKGNYIYDISGDVNQILSTFKFTN